MERAMNDNNDDKGIRLFHVFFMVFSAVLILGGLALAGTMIYGVYKMNAEQAAGEIAVIERDENMADVEKEPMPQMFTLPDELGTPGGGMHQPISIDDGVVDMNSVDEEQKDDLSLPLFNHQAEEGGKEKDFLPKDMDEQIEE